MKALIRGTEEIYPESMWSAYTRTNLEWYYTKAPEGNGYALVDDYTAGSAPSDYDVTERTVTDEEGYTKTLLTAVIKAGWKPSF